MIHWLVCGESGSGKSRSMREAVIPAWRNPSRFRLRRPARNVLVLDPQLKADWGATWVTKDPLEWLAALKKSRSCVGVYDEAGNQLESDPKLTRDMGWAAMESRNNGHLIYFLAQRAGQLPLGMRNQCGQAYVFNQRSEFDRRWLAITYGEGMRSANRLEVGQCLIGLPMKNPVLCRFF